MQHTLPAPRGYHLLVRMHKLPERQGALFLPETHKAVHDLASITGQVVALGPDAYLDHKRFPSGPRCAEGDWVMFRSYSGTRFKHVGDGEEYRLINDDTVEAVLADPNLVERV